MIVDKLKKIVTTLGGSYTAKDDTVSELLENINTAFENGGGGGSGLPTVTTDDNGKLLGVTDGAWNKVDAPTVDGEVVYVPFAVTAGAGGMSATTTATFADVKAAVEANKTVVGQVTVNEQAVIIAPCNLFYPVENITAISFNTVAKLNNSDKPTLYRIVFTSETVIVETVELT